MASDGALAAPIRGQMCHIGYFDEEAVDPTKPQGFLTTEQYVVQGSEVLSLKDNQILGFKLYSEFLLREFDGAEVRLTTRGDVALTTLRHENEAKSEPHSSQDLIMGHPQIGTGRNYEPWTSLR